MLDAERSMRFIADFVGQWLRTRDLHATYIDLNFLVHQEKSQLDPDSSFHGIPEAMASETELSFNYVLKANRSLDELLTADYTYLNESLAKIYDIDGVQGQEMRKVDLHAESNRGGILRQGTMLVVTSNPRRTSPVKRGLYILENLLGTPPPPSSSRHS